MKPKALHPAPLRCLENAIQGAHAPESGTFAVIAMDLARDANSGCISGRATRSVHAGKVFLFARRSSPTFV